MLVRSGLLALLAAALLTGCSIDGIEWESTGFPVEEVAHHLETELHVGDPMVECIKREVGGSLWECRATAERRRFTCEVKVGVRERIRSLECEGEEEGAEHEAPEEGEEPDGAERAGEG